jgi:hypothetical protein
MALRTAATPDLAMPPWTVWFALELLLRSGWRMTRHPERDLRSNPAVAARELVDSSPGCPLFPTWPVPRGEAATPQKFAV